MQRLAPLAGITVDVAMLTLIFIDLRQVLAFVLVDLTGQRSLTSAKAKAGSDQGEGGQTQDYFVL